MRAVGYSTQAWLPVFGVLVACSVLAAACASGEGSAPAEDGASPAAPTFSTDTTSSAAATSAVSPPASGSTSSEVVTSDTVSEGSSADAPSELVTTAAATVPSAEPSKEWTLLAGGDVLMDRTELQGVDPFEFVEPALASADLAAVNAEMAISDRGVPADKQFAFRAPPSAARRMASAGIDVANLANNHAKDFGPSALVDTVELLEDAGVVAVGAGDTDVEAYRYRVLRTPGEVSVAFVGVSMIVPRGFPAGPGSPGIASARPASPIMESVRRAADEADVVVALVHWGVERATCPNKAQRDFAAALLDAGADAVIGHHPHVLQPVEFADGRLVAYSLGNFVWHPRWGITGETGVLQIDFDSDEIVGWAFHPHLLNEDGAPVPVAEGGRHDRIVDIIGGDCERHQPPPPSTTTTATSSTTSTSADTSTTTIGTTDTTAGDG